MKKKSDSGQLGETAQEKLLADQALQRYQQYKEKWLPLQEQAIRLTQNMGKAGSMERERAVTHAAGDVGGAYDQAQEQANAALAGRGVSTDSSAYRMAGEKIDTAKAGAQGIAGAGAEDAIDKAYVEGLTSIMATGKNQSDMAMRSSEMAAGMAAQDQAARARASAARKASTAKFLTQGISAAGMAFGSMPGAGGGGSGTGFGFSGPNKAAQYTPGIDI